MTVWECWLEDGSVEIILESKLLEAVRNDDGVPLGVYVFGPPEGFEFRPSVERDDDGVPLDTPSRTDGYMIAPKRSHD